VTKTKGKADRHNGPVAQQAGRRLSPEQRERQIIEGAIAFFAERGFGGQTRELTTQLGLSKGLLYRYFKSKDDLIDRIYEEVFLKNWKPGWSLIIADTSRPLLDRLQELYLGFSQLLHDKAFVRLYLYSGLTGASINKRYWALVEAKIFLPVISEFRREFGRPTTQDEPVSEPEIELMWSLHGSIFYIGLRKWVYQVQVPTDVPGAVRRIVDTHYSAARSLMQGPHS